MLVSVFTPTHDATWMGETYQSLKNQTYSNWEWVIVPNSPVGTQPLLDLITTITSLTKNDERVKIYPYVVTSSYHEVNNIGALKRFACLKCKGNLFVELDHDDMLASTALEDIVCAHESTKAGFIYSDWAEFNVDGSYATYSSDYGWESYSANVDGKVVTAISAFEPTARSLCEIFYAPNHVRAWARTTYENIGGHSPTLGVADDHDLVCRTYLAGTKFVHIAKPLYLYRRHTVNSCVVLNASVQRLQNENKLKYLHKLVYEECDRKKLPIIELTELVRPDTFDIQTLTIDGLIGFKWGNKVIANSSIGCIKADNVLQLIPTNIVERTMHEIYRALAPGGWLLSTTPSTDGRAAFQDVRAKSYWNENSWLYWTKKSYSDIYYPGTTKETEAFRPKFQMVSCKTVYPNEELQKLNMSYVFADICALKQQRQPGIKEI